MAELRSGVHPSSWDVFNWSKAQHPHATAGCQLTGVWPPMLPLACADTALPPPPPRPPCSALFAMPERLRGENLFYSFDVGFLHVMVYNTGALCCSQEGGDRRAKGLAGVRRPLPLLLSKGRRI